MPPLSPLPNAVGYGDKTTENFEFIGPSFMKIGDDQQFTYADIKVNCAETEDDAAKGWQANLDGIIILDQNGTYVRRLVYIPQYLADYVSAEAGWYDSDKTAEEDFSECLSGEKFNFGEALQVATAPGTGAKATFAGQVKESPTVVDVANFMSVANCSPVEINLGDIVVNCSETEDGANKGWQANLDGVIILDKNGTYVQRLVYIPQYLADYVGAKAGWYDSDKTAEEDFSECLNDKFSFAPGGGFQVGVAAGTGATVSIKSALAK